MLPHKAASQEAALIIPGWGSEVRNPSAENL